MLRRHSAGAEEKAFVGPPFVDPAIANAVFVLHNREHKGETPTGGAQSLVQKQTLLSKVAKTPRHESLLIETNVTRRHDWMREQA